METIFNYPEMAGRPLPLTKEEVLEKMKDPAVVLVNVLARERFDSIHIQGSQNLALGPNVHAFEIAAGKRFSKKSDLITYGEDATGTLVHNAAKLLAFHGYKVNYYPGGLHDWSRAGWPTSGTGEPAPAPMKRKRKK